MSPLRGFFGCVSPTHYHRQTHESRRPSPPDHSPLPHLRRRGLFSTYPLHNRVLRVTSPTLHSGSGALFGNDFLANLPQDLCELLRDCLRMLGLANALHSGPEGGLVQGWPLRLQICSVPGPQTIPKPAPKSLHWVQIRRAGRNLPQAHLCGP